MVYHQIYLTICREVPFLSDSEGGEAFTSSDVKVFEVTYRDEELLKENGNFPKYEKDLIDIY